MKHVDVTKSVMEQVTRFEQERSTGWLWRFRITLGVLLGLILFILWRVWGQLQESNSLDLLTLFWEDAEIVREFWQDTVSVFIEELPQGALRIAGIVLLVIVAVVWRTRKRRQIINRRIRLLAKRRQT